MRWTYFVYQVLLLIPWSFASDIGDLWGIICSDYLRLVMLVICSLGGVWCYCILLSWPSYLRLISSKRLFTEIVSYWLSEIPVRLARAGLSVYCDRLLNASLQLFYWLLWNEVSTNLLIAVLGIWASSL